jgi:hypothetical protein
LLSSADSSRILRHLVVRCLRQTLAGFADGLVERIEACVHRHECRLGEHRRVGVSGNRLQTLDGRLVGGFGHLELLDAATRAVPDSAGAGISFDPTQPRLDTTSATMPPRRSSGASPIRSLPARPDGASAPTANATCAHTRAGGSIAPRPRAAAANPGDIGRLGPARGTDVQVLTDGGGLVRRETSVVELVDAFQAVVTGHDVFTR